MIFSSYRPRGILHKVYTRKLPLPSLRGLCTPLLLCIYHFSQKSYPFICPLENGSPFLISTVRCFYRPYTKKGPYQKHPLLLPREFPCNILIQSLGLLFNGRLQNVIVNKLRQLIQVTYRI